MEIILILILAPLFLGYMIAMTRFVDNFLSHLGANIKREWNELKFRIQKIKIITSGMKEEYHRQMRLRKENTYFDKKLPKLKKELRTPYLPQDRKDAIIAERLTHVTHGHHNIPDFIPLSRVNLLTQKLVAWFIGKKENVD